MTAPDQVVELVNRFTRNRDSYKSSGYNEAQTRREFIDPLFVALGWDMDNRKGRYPQLAGRSRLVPPQSSGCPARLLSRRGRRGARPAQGSLLLGGGGRDGRSLRDR
jgi:hypothetical protein